VAEKQPLGERPSILRRTAPASDAPAVPKKQKATFYLSADAIKHLKTVQFQEYERTGRQPDLSELVGRAIMLLHPQDSTPLNQ
jgi:hypothetical protein